MTASEVGSQSPSHMVSTDAPEMEQVVKLYCRAVGIYTRPHFFHLGIWEGLSNSRTVRSETVDHKVDGRNAKQILLNSGRWRLSVMGAEDLGSQPEGSELWGDRSPLKSDFSKVTQTVSWAWSWDQTPGFPSHFRASSTFIDLYFLFCNGLKLGRQNHMRHFVCSINCHLNFLLNIYLLH